MKKKTPELKALPFPFFLLCLITLGVVATMFLWKKISVKTSSNLQTEKPMPQEFASEPMKMSFLIPSDMTVEEGYNIVTLKNNRGIISIIRTGTNFNNAKDHVDVLAQRNSFKDYIAKPRYINNYDSIEVHFTDKTQPEKAYYIYTDHVIYAFRANNPQLFPDLNMIVSSFSYSKN